MIEPAMDGQRPRLARAPRARRYNTPRAMNSRRPSPTAPAAARPSAPGASPWRASRERLRARELKREAVIRAAAREFNRKGYHNTSLDDIATALEVTKPTVYYYVTSKEQLLFECFVAGVEHIRRLIREGVQDGSIAPCDPKLAAFALAGALNWIAHWYREDQSLTGAEIAAAFVAIFEGGLRPRGSASPLRARALPARRTRGTLSR